MPLFVIFVVHYLNNKEPVLAYEDEQVAQLSANRLSDSLLVLSCNVEDYDEREVLKASQHNLHDH